MSAAPSWAHTSEDPHCDQPCYAELRRLLTRNIRVLAALYSIAHPSAHALDSVTDATP